MAPSKGGTTVLVTGAAGYIGTHVVSILLQKGYKVRGAELFPEKCPHLQAWIDEGKSLELVKVDLLKPETWPPAMAGCKYVIHMAAVVEMDVPDSEAEERLIKPAVAGALNVLRAAADSGTVKRVVMTSSVGALGDPTALAAQARAGVPVDANMWSDPITSTPYCRSKVQAEKAAWDFVKSEAGKGLELVAINPGVVVGRSLSPHCHESMRLITRIVSRGSSAVPELMLPMVNVEDVAACHVQALTADKAVGNRFILVQQVPSLLEITQFIYPTLTPLGYSVPNRRLPNFILWVLTWFDTTLARSAPLNGLRPSFECSPGREVLGLPERECLSGVLDICIDAVEKGYLHSTPQFEEWNAKRKAESTKTA